MITLYVLDLENADDAMFCQYLTSLQLNIIALNPQLNIDSEVETMMTTVIHEAARGSPVGIKVTIHIPQNIKPHAKQQKINRIYEILKPRYKGGGLYEEDHRHLCASLC